MCTRVKEETKSSSPKSKQKPSGKNKQQLTGEDARTVMPDILLPDIEVPAEDGQQQLQYPEPVTQQKLEEYAGFLNRAKTLQLALETDLLACDAKWTLFVAAVFSYRYDSVLQPFPPQFGIEKSGYDIDALMSVIKDTPKLSIVLQYLMRESYHLPSPEVIDLLYWVLVLMGETDLRLVEGEELNSLLASIDDRPPKVKPTHVFEVVDVLGFHSDARFYAKTENRPLKLAFMGNKLENYFSLLQNGFPQLPENTKNLKLTTNLETSLQHSAYCAAWGASQCGSIISCTAVCQFAIDVDADKITTNKTHKSCVDIQLSNFRNIRLRYLIFYGRRFPGSLLKKPSIFSWLYSYKYTLSIISYTLLLLSIGVANSGSGEMVKLYVSKKIDFLIDFCRRGITKDVFNK